MLIYFTVLESFYIGYRDSCVRGLLARLAQVFRRLKRAFVSTLRVSCCFSIVTSLVLVATCYFCYSALFANGFRAKARCVAKRFVVNFCLTFSVYYTVRIFFYCGASAGPLFCGRRWVYCSRLPTAAMAESQGQDSSLFSSQAVIRLSPCVLNNVQAVVMECGPGANSSTYNKEKVVAEASKDRASLSKSPLPEEMPPPTAERTSAGPNGGTPLPKRKRGAITPSSQPKGKTSKVARSRSDSAPATLSTSQKASHSGRRGGSQTRDLESMSTNCSGSGHDVSARVVLVATPQDLNPAPPVSGRSVGSFFTCGARGGEGRFSKCAASQRAAFSLPP